MAGLQGFRDSLAKLSELFSAGLISDEDYNERKVCCSLVLFFLDPPEPGQRSKVWCVRLVLSPFQVVLVDNYVGVPQAGAGGRRGAGGRGGGSFGYGGRGAGWGGGGGGGYGSGYTAAFPIPATYQGLARKDPAAGHLSIPASQLQHRYLLHFAADLFFFLAVTVLTSRTEITGQT